MAFRRPEPLGKHHRIDAFQCGQPVLDVWLKRHGRGAQASDSARVLVSTREDRETVIAYYALAAAQVSPQEATARALAGQPLARPVSAILLARFAVHVECQGIGLGRSLLHDVLLRCAAASEAIGARVLIVHAKNEAAKAWYAQHGFEESPTDPLHLLLLMKDVRAFLRRYEGDERRA